MTDKAPYPVDFVVPVDDEVRNRGLAALGFVFFAKALLLIPHLFLLAIYGVVVPGHSVVAGGHCVAAGSPTVRTWMSSSLARRDQGTRLLSGLRGVDMGPSLAIG